MTKNVGGTPARASDTGSAHRLCDDDRDGTMRTEGAKRSAGADKEYIGVCPRPTVLQVGRNRMTHFLGQR